MPFAHFSDKVDGSCVITSLLARIAKEFTPTIAQVFVVTLAIEGDTRFEAIDPHRTVSTDAECIPFFKYDILPSQCIGQ
ncbi:hypothetical protein D3C79_1030420 [compost metagenome]